MIITDREALAELAKKCALYFDSIEMVECNWALWQDIINALRADTAATQPSGSAVSMREALDPEAVLAMASRLCAEWQTSQHRQHGFAVDELNAFMAGVKAALAAPQPQAQAAPNRGDYRDGERDA